VENPGPDSVTSTDLARPDRADRIPKSLDFPLIPESFHISLPFHVSYNESIANFDCLRGKEL